MGQDADLNLIQYEYSLTFLFQFNQVVYGLRDSIEDNVIMSKISNQEQTPDQEAAADDADMRPYTSPTQEDIVNHSYENQTPNAFTNKMTTGSKENIAKENVANDEYEICTSSLGINRSAGEVNKTQLDSKKDIKYTESNERKSEMHVDYNRDEAKGSNIPIGIAEMRLLEDEGMLNMPPPSPCKSDAGIDYMNVPKYATPFHSDQKINRICNGYVNMSDDMKLSTKDKSNRHFKNKNTLHFSSDPNLSISESTGGSIDTNYVNAPENLERPPRYDETSFKLRQGKIKEPYDSDIQFRPDYTNIPEKESEFKNVSSIEKDYEKSDCGIRNEEKLHLETDLYLPMDFPDKQEEYIPMDNPDTLNSYEKSTLLNHSSKARFGNEVQSVNEICSVGYVNTQQGTYISLKASSCDSLYSYADPKLVRTLYSGTDSVTNIPHCKSRAASRSKTFSPADSKGRPYKIGKWHKRSVEKASEKVEMHDPKLSANISNSQQIMSNYIKNTSKEKISLTDAIDAGYVNTGLTISETSKEISKLSKIPISTRRKSSGEVNVKLHTDDSKIKTKPSNIPIVTKRKASGERQPKRHDNDCKVKRETSDGIEHDYENEMPTRCTKPPGVRKTKGPAVLPKPKLPNKSASQAM